MGIAQTFSSGLKALPSFPRKRESRFLFWRTAQADSRFRGNDGRFEILRA